MPYNPTKRHLSLVRGGEHAMGPVERLGLRNDARMLSTRQLAFLIAGKILLLASLAYVYYT